MGSSAAAGATGFACRREAGRPALPTAVGGTPGWGGPRGSSAGRAGAGGLAMAGVDGGPRGWARSGVVGTA
eukprot:4024375-Alexandrium_andersonii.AAC.1